jgi:hypothetical protein
MQLGSGGGDAVELGSDGSAGCAPGIRCRLVSGQYRLGQADFRGLFGLERIHCPGGRARARASVLGGGENPGA